MNSKMKFAAVAVALIVVPVGLTSPSEAKPSAPSCSVSNLKVTEETLSRPGETRVLAYRWHKVETIKCGSRYVDITTDGIWLRKTPFYR